MRHRTPRGAIAQFLRLLGVMTFTVSCGDREAQVLSTAATSPTSSSPAISPAPTSTTLDPLAPTTVPFDPSLPSCIEDEPNRFLVPSGDVSVVHLTLKIADPGVTGLTDSGFPVLNAALAVGADCQLGDGPSQRVLVAGREPRWDVLSVDGVLPDPDAGSDLAHLVGRNATTQVFYNCVGSDPNLDLADILATIVATSSLTCRSSPGIYAA